MNLIKQYKLKVKIDLYNHDSHEYDTDIEVFVIASDDYLNAEEKEKIANRIADEISQSGDTEYSGCVDFYEVVERLYTLL